MSAIEEAREQAREALEQQTRAVLEGYGMSAIAVNLRDALRALLDATEPPRAAVCEWCPASARGTAWHNDGRLHLSCGQIDHGQGWVPDEPAAILATDLATEPQETTSPAAETQLEAVTSAIEKVLDGQGTLHCTRVWEAWGYGTMSEDDFSPVTNDAEAVNEIASAVIEALGPRPITDEMVKAGARALNDAGWTYEGADEPGCWCEDCQAVCILPARAALEAAEEARR